ncbi:MAG: NlpC/P60 family protein [Saprospirales bacterium]|nr:MAG: NlpC/P60 family protein [Saprospirales bacterium]
MRNIYLLFFFGLLALLLSSCSSSSNMVSPRNTAAEPEVVSFAISKVGSAYRFGSAGPNRFDCSGFTWYVYHQKRKDIGRTTSCQSNAGRRINASRAAPGDLIFFGKGRKMQHVGIVVSNENGNLRMVHASSSRGVIVESVSNSPYWSRRIKFAVRLDA